MKKCILVFILFGLVFAIAGSQSVGKIERLNKKLEKVENREIKIKDNQKKYNKLMTEYKIISLRYRRVIESCKKNNCKDEAGQLSQNFKKLNQSIETLDDMLETDIAAINSVKRQRNIIEAMIRMEKRKKELDVK